jgi:preprotein translocase subunit SecG
MYTLVIVLIIIVAILLVLVVLLQNAKGGGFASGFAGTGSNQLLGVKRTSDLLEQLTWGFAIALIILTLSTSFLINSGGEGRIKSVNVERAQEKRSIPAAAPTAPSSPSTKATQNAGDSASK